ncbi:MAG: hypothetical protein NW220_21885 [Leptolyngbyaceae cyanobacterium bins.349]|nr:hypothetical protein [Leptolyngbyaceae cyanobacterium bins.349]
MLPSSDESLGLEYLPQSQLESVPGLKTSPQMEADMDMSGLTPEANTASPELVLRSLIAENGLVVVLEALRNIMETQAERLQDSSMQPYAKQLKSFQKVAEDLAELLEALPAELDMEIALTQITHATPAIESTSTTLTEELSG